MRSCRTVHLPVAISSRAFCAGVLLAPLLLLLVGGRGNPLRAQDPLSGDPLATPLPQETLMLLTNEVSGQKAFDNLVKLGGAPWMRTEAELTGETNFYESQELLRMVQGYGIETVRLDRYPREGTFAYPVHAELWVWEGEGNLAARGGPPNVTGMSGAEPAPAHSGRLLARIPDDPALVARGSATTAVTGPLVYVPQVGGDQLAYLDALISAEPERYRESVLLLWSHPRGELFDLLDRAGVGAVISFSARERYLDPDQVVYARGSYGDGENLRLGMTVSWRQWTELLEDVQSGRPVMVRAEATVEEYPDRYETVYAWIPGTEPEEKGVVFTGHLFEGYLKRGTNDNLGGPAIQLEILRALHHLMDSGRLPRPRRTLHFIWPQEISGTYEFIGRNPELIDALAVNINMDMVSEGLRKNNAVFTMSETPPHLSSYFDGLAHDVLSYVWRTNDIVYLPDSPRGRPGGQYFPRPMVEKNGSRDAFRFFIHEATGGSDHIVFNNPSVAVPGIEFFTWPDQWYHADKDLPENADPTEMRRVAFIGAATGWASANLTDAMVPDLLDAVSSFGYARVAERGIPRALEHLHDGGPGEDARLPAGGTVTDEALAVALNVIGAAVEREKDAVLSVHEIHSGSREAAERVRHEVEEWDHYGDALESFLLSLAAPEEAGPAARPAPDPDQERYENVVPSLAPEIRGREFNLWRFEPARRWFQDHPQALDDLELTEPEGQAILEWVNGRRSVTTIRNRVAAWTRFHPTVEQVAGFLRVLEEIGWIRMEGG